MIRGEEVIAVPIGGCTRLAMSKGLEIRLLGNPARIRGVSIFHPSRERFSLWRGSMAAVLVGS